ncbi:MAG TPA: Ig-like domain-containing protein [Nannocystaceae bacterium]|nr:Ig-like domain-containing protein [Nannocystaceae bacterium]
MGSTPALAGDPPELAALKQQGLGQSRGDPIPVPADAPRLRSQQSPKFGGTPGRIFVNFDGANLSSGYDDSTQDVTQIGECAGSFAAYGNGAKRDATMQAVRDDWAAYNVTVVDARPASGDYTMCMVGPSNPFGGGVLGIAPLDCDDQQTHNNITYAFHSENDQFDASTTATTIGQEVAHSYGLEHVDEPGDIMNPYNAGGNPSFTDQCIGIVQGIVCGSQHAAECGSQSQQNSHQELLTLFGPSAPDNSSPTVTITYPADGAEFDAGSDFEITVDASDDIAIENVTLYNNGTEQSSDASSPYGWAVNDIPEGTYEFYVEASDPSGNISMSATVTIGVGGAPSTTANDDGGSDGGADDGGGDDGTDGGGVDDGGADDAGDDGGVDDGGDSDPDNDGLPPGYGLDRDAPQACACTTEGVGPGGPHALPIGLAALVVLGLVRRRGKH